MSKIYTNRIKGDQNLRQKLRKLFQHLNRRKIMYLIKYTLTEEFSIQDYTRQLQNNNLLNMKSENKFLLPFYQQKNTLNLDQKVNYRQNTVCLEQQIYASPENFTPTLLVVLETFRRSALTHLM